jgi:hypothetical protein
MPDTVSQLTPGGVFIVGGMFLCSFFEFHAALTPCAEHFQPEMRIIVNRTVEAAAVHYLNRTFAWFQPQPMVTSDYANVTLVLPTLHTTESNDALYFALRCWESGTLTPSGLVVH